MKRFFSCKFIVALFSFLFFIGLAQAAEPIKFGFIHSLSGGIGQVYGVPDLAGVKMAVKEINDAGGVLGRPLEVIERDDKLSPETGARVAKDLVLSDKVVWLQGNVSSAVALAISAYAKEVKIPYITSAAQSAAITGEKGHRYVFRISTNTTNYCRSIANAAAKLWGGKKVFILGPDYEYGHRSKKDFMDAYTKAVPDAKVVGELWPKLGNQDWTPYISKIMSSDADFVYCSLWGGDVISFTKAAINFGYFDRIKHCGQDWGNMEALSKMDKQVYPKGVLGGSHYPYWLIDNPISNQLAGKFIKETGMYPGLSISGYTTVYAMKKAIEKAGGTDPEKVIDSLENLEIDAAVGKLVIRKCDHQSMWPFWVGKVIVTKDQPWPHISDAILLDPSQGYRSCEEISQVRAQQ